MITSLPTKNRRERGQSLVETALLLPILLLIIAGLVEISNLIIIQSKVDTAARIGARFGANGGEPAGIRVAALNSVTQTLELEEGMWDMWVFEGTLNSIGTAFSVWNWEHVYGEGQTEAYAGVQEIELQQDVLENLRSQGDQNAAGVKIVGMLIHHDVETILGLENYIQGLNSVRGFAVMEVAPVMEINTLDGCDAFPLIIEYGQRSTNETEYNSIRRQDWDYPRNNNIPAFSSFVGHVDDIPLAEAIEGSLYLFRSSQSAAAGNCPPGGCNVYEIGGVNTNVDFVAWSVDPAYEPDSWNNLQEAQASLTWPGNSGSTDPAVAYIDPVIGPSSQNGMHAWDPITGAYDTVSQTKFNSNYGIIKQLFDVMIDRGRVLRFLAYDRDLPGGGWVETPRVNITDSEGAYKIRGFVLGRIVGYKLSGSDHWIMIEMLRWDDSCGQRAP